MTTATFTADNQDLYPTFVDSDEWKSQIEAIREISPDAATAIENYGIGTKIDSNGEYDFESGQLLDDMPITIRNSDAVEEAYDAICNLAEAYAQFVSCKESSL
jgi:hypothetical protein